MKSYWEAIEPLFATVDFHNGPDAFAASITSVPRSSVLLFSAHMCVAEVHNGGFLQLFWNNTGVLVPEAIEGLTTIGMPIIAALVREAASPLGSQYPRDRDERWDALLVASRRSSRDLKRIFKNAENLYLAFQKAALTLPFDSLDRRVWECAKTEGGGFQEAATRYARHPHLIQ